jgi:hypothetical protein
MNTTITQPAPYFVSPATTFSATTPAEIMVKRSASPDGAVITATNQSVPTDACTERAKGQVFVNAATATKEPSATNARPIQDAKMASASSLGSAAARRTGVEYSATKVSNKSL